MKISVNTPINTQINDITILHINKPLKLATYKCKCGIINKTDVYYLNNKTICTHHTPVTKENLYWRWCILKRRHKNELCKQWHNYNNFKTWALKHYQENLNLTRIDKTKPFSPKNCHFTISKSKQTPKIKYLYKNKLLSISTISKVTNIPYITIYRKLQRHNIKPKSSITKLLRRTK